MLTGLEAFHAEMPDRPWQLLFTSLPPTF